MIQVSGRVHAVWLIVLILTWRGQFLRRQNIHADVEAEADVGELLAPQAPRHAAGNRYACQWRD